MGNKLLMLFVIACVACGQKEDGPSLGVGAAAKGDGPDVVVRVNAESPLSVLLQASNQTPAFVLYFELCRGSWWERKVVVEAAPEEGGEEVITWEAAGVPVQCWSDTQWESVPQGERSSFSISLPVDAADQAPTPGTYRLAVDVVDDYEGQSLGIVRSNEIVVSDRTNECETLCAKVESCAAPNSSYDAAECAVWCKTILAAAFEPVVRDCTRCFEHEQCSAILLEPLFPLELSTGNPGACMVDCRVGECETEADCGEGYACAYDIDWTTYEFRWGCFEITP